MNTGLVLKLVCFARESSKTRFYIGSFNTMKKPISGISERLQIAKKEIEEICERYGVYLEADNEGQVHLIAESEDKIKLVEIET